MRTSLSILLVVLAAVLFLSCNEKITDNPIANQKPSTFLWLVPDSTIGVGVSRQRLRWWGEDPDGLVKGYLFAYKISEGVAGRIPNPDTLRYSWITANDTTILFPLDTLFRRFTVVVRSVDNSFEGLPNQSIVRLSPSPYWDKNANGVFEATDQALTSLAGAVDSRGATLTFPIRNTRPTIAFARNPNDPNIVLKQPDTTFTVATFAWKGSDNDGDNTLASYRIALNDTTNAANWVNLGSRDTVITLVVPRPRSDSALANAAVAADIYLGDFLNRRLLDRKLPGLRLNALNKLYVQVRDVAGEFSPIISMPSGTDHWFVKKPLGNLLIVTDYLTFDADLAISTYLSSLGAVPGGEFDTVDQLNISRGLSLTDKNNDKPGPLVPPYIDPALIWTFSLYKYVFWYTDIYPSLRVAQLTLFTYVQNGGKVLFSTSFRDKIDPRGALNDFAPIDSVASNTDILGTWNPGDPPRRGDSRVNANYRLLPDSSVPGNIYPVLAFNASPIRHSIFVRPIYRRSDARYIYRLQRDTVAAPNGPRYIGTPELAVVDGQGKTIFVGLPLHLLNNTLTGNPQGLRAFFTKIFTQQFSQRHQINWQKLSKSQ